MGKTSGRLIRRLKDKWADEVDPCSIAVSVEVEVVLREVRIERSLTGCQYRPEINETGAWRGRPAQLQEPLIEFLKLLFPGCCSWHDALHEDGAFRGTLADALKDASNVPLDHIDRQTPCEVISPDEEKDGTWFVNRRVQPIQDLSGSFSTNSSIQNLYGRKPLLPQSALTDAVSQKDNTAWLSSECSKLRAAMLLLGTHHRVED
ncbi:hypothetical protein GCM10010052_19170 [Paenarthrobacter histidinolovorans]|nr:hypothetical protein GCM10010052_19170 [Paenarthrobacter histidinolovorans]